MYELSGGSVKEHCDRKPTVGAEMVYTIEEGQLLRLWTVIRYFGVIREIQDPVAQAEILTDAQILLTAFVLDLQPAGGDQTSSAPPRTGLDRIVTFGA
jgi:hypothetical protein